jgi:hypothetical protein
LAGRTISWLFATTEGKFPRLAKLIAFDSIFALEIVKQIEASAKKPLSLQGLINGILISLGDDFALNSVAVSLMSSSGLSIGLIIGCNFRNFASTASRYGGGIYVNGLLRFECADCSGQFCQSGYGSFLDVEICPRPFWNNTNLLRCNCFTT